MENIVIVDASLVAQAAKLLARNAELNFNDLEVHFDANKEMVFLAVKLDNNDVGSIDAIGYLDPA